MLSSSMTMHPHCPGGDTHAVRLRDNASTLPWGAALGCRLSLKNSHPEKA